MPSLFAPLIFLALLVAVVKVLLDLFLATGYGAGDAGGGRQSADGAGQRGAGTA